MRNDGGSGAGASRAEKHAAGGNPSDRPAQQALLALLEMALAAREPAEQMVADGLRHAGRERLPSDGPGLVAFVQAHILEPLSGAIGPRLTMALFTDLVAQLDAGVPANGNEPSAPPSSLTWALRSARSEPSGARPRCLGVVLVDVDRIGRTALARALVRAEWEVTVVDTPSDLATALEADEPVDVALVDTDHPSTHDIVQILGLRRPRVPIVARSADAAKTRALVARLTKATLDVRSRDARPQELIDAIRQVVG